MRCGWYHVRGSQGQRLVLAVVASLSLVLTLLVAQSLYAEVNPECKQRSSVINILPVIEYSSSSAKGGHKKTRKERIEQALKCTVLLLWVHPNANHRYLGGRVPVFEQVRACSLYYQECPPCCPAATYILRELWKRPNTFLDVNAALQRQKIIYNTFYNIACIISIQAYIMLHCS